MTINSAEQTIETRLLMLDELLALKRLAEIIDGRVIDVMGVGGLHHLIAHNIYRILDAFASRTGIGEVFFDGLLYLMFVQETFLKHAYIPDVSFLRTVNIPANWDVEKPYPGVPDLAVEAISSDDDAEDVQVKLRTYLDRGTEQVWLVYPKTKELHQYIAGEVETVRIYKGSQKIDAEALFPGIEGLTTDAIFALPEWAAK